MSESIKLAARQEHQEDTVLQIGNVRLGGNYVAIIAGPCAVESEEQTLRIAHQVKQAGAHILRGGAYKPRTSPYSFQGLGLAALKILHKAKQQTGLPFVTEALDMKSLELVYEYADIIQIGARNMHNFSLLREVGKLDKPVLLKRGMSATLTEWLLAAEYILERGNHRVILCERGVRSFEPHTRNMLDLAAVPSLLSRSHLPVAVDPSHGTGRRELVAPMAQADLVAGAHAIMVDVHDRPQEALCDGPQALHPQELTQMVSQLHDFAKVLHKTMHA